MLSNLNTYFEYNDPVSMIWRDAPYPDRADALPVINGIITLLEIPSSDHKVRITGLIEIERDELAKKKVLAENEFIVNYANGVIQFHARHEGKSFLCSYKGKGMIMYPASRVYAMIDRNPDIIKTLQDIIDEILERISTYSEKLIQINEAISDATLATANTNVAADNAHRAAETALDAASQAVEAIQHAMKIYKPPVNYYSDLSSAYPRPELGWTVMVRTTGNIYRWDGASWVLIENFTQIAFPAASPHLNGLMSKEDYVAFHERLELRPIMFALGRPKFTGIPPLLFQFPFDGEIKEIKAYCIQSGVLVPTEIEIQKISESTFETEAWDNILSSNILFDLNMKQSTTHSIQNKTVHANDYFRLNITSVDQEIQGITIQMNIQT